MSERDKLADGWLAEQIVQAKREIASLPAWARRALRFAPGRKRDDDPPQS